MIIAVTYDNGTVFQHFGHSERFKLYEAEGGKVLSTRILEADGSGALILLDHSLRVSDAG